MSTIAIIENKISAILRYLVLLKNYAKYDKDTLEKDLTVRGAVERYLYLGIQATLELAEAVIAYKHLRKPSRYSESFEILAEAGLITAEIQEKMIKMSGFRNIISHDYEKLNFAIVHEVLAKRLGDMEEFVGKVKGSL